MKLVCDTSIISEACANVQRAVAAKSVNPAMEGIYFKPAAQGLELYGYDGEVGITTVLAADAAEGNGTVINAKLLCDILRHLPGDKMTIETDERNKCVIRSADAEYTLIGMSEENYPELPYIVGGTPVILPQNILKDMVRGVIFAVSLNESLTVHKGVKVELTPGLLTLIALDGFRIAVRQEQVDYSGEPLSFIVPAKTLSEAVKLMNDDEGMVSIELDKNHIIFGLNGYNLVSGLLEGNFIDYRRTIPKNFSTEILLKTQDMIDSIDRISLLITERLKTPVKCVVDDEKGEVRFLCTTTLGVANDKISARIEGPGLLKCLNSRYLSDAFRAIDSDLAMVKTSQNEREPVCIFPPEGDQYFYMILPVRMPE